MSITDIEDTHETELNIPIEMNHINISDASTETLKLITGPENDHVTVNHVTGNIFIDTGAGNDRIHIYDVDGNLEIHAGHGNDKVFIHTPIAGCTVIYGGHGDDRIEGGDSGENLYGGHGNDKIIGNGGADVIEGGPNTGYFMQDSQGLLYVVNGDHLWGGYEDSSYDGESNTFVFRYGDGIQIIHDFQLWLDTLEVHGYDENSSRYFYDSENSFIALSETAGILLLNTQVESSDIDWVRPELHSHSLSPDPIIESLDDSSQTVFLQGKIWAHERDSGDPYADSHIKVTQLGDPILFLNGYPFMTHPDIASMLSSNVLWFYDLNDCPKSTMVDFEYYIDSIDLNFLPQDQELTAYYQIVATDGMVSSIPKQLTITFIGTNDIPTITGDFTGSVTVNTTPGSVTQVSGALIINDPDDGESFFQLPDFDSQNECTYTLMTAKSFDAAVTIFDNNTDIFKENTMANVISRTDSGDDSVDVAGTYGSFNFSTDGSWTYTLDDSAGSAAIQLPAGATADDFLTVVSFDGTTSVTIDVTITGTNSVPTIGGVSTGDVTVDTNPDDVVSTSGALTIDDPNTGESSFQVPDNLVGYYGTWTFDTAGNWTYTLDDSAGSTAIQLPGGVTAADSLMVTSFDGSAVASIDVTITGTNSVPVLGGVNTADVTVDPNPNDLVETWGYLTIDDPNTGESYFQMPDNLVGTYGNFSFDNYYGYWNYVLDNSTGSLAIQLPAGTVVDDVLTVTSFDGSASIDIDVTITGANSVPTIGGVNTGAVTVDTNPDDVVSTSGALTIDDPNTGENSFQVPDNLVGTYGTWTFDTAGNWTYTLDDSTGSAAIQLPGGTTADDTLTVTSFDGSATATLDVTVTGTNSVPVFGGTNTGDVTVDPNNGFVETFGQVTVDDPNTGESYFQMPDNLEGAYGTFYFDNYYGYWTYVLDDSPGSAAIQLPAGTVVDDVLPLTSFDGSATTNIDVTITGANSVAVIGGTNTGAVTVDTNPDDVVSTSGALTIDDPNTGESSFIVPDNLMGTYGAWTLDTAGNWTYTLDDSAGSAAIQLPGGTTADDTLTVTSFDGTASTVIDVTVTGTNSVPTIGGVDTGAVTVDTNPDDVVSTSGALTIADPNTGESSFQIPDNLVGTYGSFTFDADGNWTYTLDDSAGSPAIQLPGGATADDTLTVTSFDGSATATIDVTVTGTNSTPTVGGENTGAVTVDTTGAPVVVSGVLTIDDPNAGESSFQLPIMLNEVFADHDTSSSSVHFHHFHAIELSSPLCVFDFAHQVA
jgi:VCBS repeat-containing protein